ncbi:hypothetical protein [Pseudomonas lini]|uniref:Uncharacterized protein n=1 Tax=Pseudomonas lini TaxID=163011 RepID=A0A1H2BAV9_9PSED|nr:hypothetical protein [Pseudomonas lini]KAB0498260.1 hypothetical protein F7R14_27360 [Pseudomonas lini]SDT55029.1 hypothetical protein SAMN04490191_5121 [Pseudomonas lini]
MMTQLQTDIPTDSDQEEWVERDGVRMPVSEALELADRIFQGGQYQASLGEAFSDQRSFEEGTAGYSDYKAGFEAPYKQAEWSVELTGDHKDLEALANAGSRSDYFRIWGGVDDWHDCPNDRYYFNTLYFEGLRDEEVVWQLTYELLGIFNSTAEFFSLDAWKQSVRTIRYRDSPISFRPKANVLRLIGRPPRMSHRKWRKHLADASLVSPRFVLVILATEKEDIYMMLKYFSEPGSWSTYYKVMETMETLARQKGFSVPVAKTAKSRFTNNANNFDVVGYDARHGLMPKGKDNPVEPMTLEEGHVFITGFCKSYLNLAYPEFFNFC